MDGEEPIFLWWIGEREVDPALMDRLRLALGRLFELPVALWEGRERPTAAYDPRRGQWASGKVLKWLLEAGPGAGRLLGVTDRDLFSPILTYVFGEAQLGGRGAVMSTARLRQEFYGLPPDAELLYRRTEKEALHELGHTFGLIHCQDYACLMHFSNSIEEVDLKGDRFCEQCAARLTGRPQAPPASAR